MEQQYEVQDNVVLQMRLNALKERKIYFLEEFYTESVFKTIRHIEQIIKSDVKKGLAPIQSEPIWIYFESPGGSLIACMSLISTIRQYQRQGYKFHGVAMGMCASAALFSFMCCDLRIAQEFSQLILHDQRCMEHGLKTVRDKRREYEEWEKEWKVLKSLIMEYTIIPEKLIEDYVEKGLDFVLNTQEAIEYGLVDKML